MARFSRGLRIATFGCVLALMTGGTVQAQVLSLDSFTQALNTDGAFAAFVTRSPLGNGALVATGSGEGRLLADNLEAPTFSGFVYDFSPYQTVSSVITVWGRNRQTSASETGVLSVRLTTGSGLFTLSKTLPGSTPVYGQHDYDFSALAGATTVIQKLELIWDLHPAATGLRGFAVGEIQLAAVPEPSSMALLSGLGCLGVVAGRRIFARR